MNQKLLTRLFYSFLVVMVIAALFLLNYQVKQNKKREQGGSNINVLSRVDTDNLDSSSQKTKQEIINVTSVDVDVDAESMEPTTTVPLSYLSIYHQLQTAKACRSFYQFWRNNGLEVDITSVVRPPVKLYGEANYLPNDKVPLTVGQTETLKTWVQKCHGLWEEYGEFEPEPNHLIPKNDVADTITKRLVATVAKTNKEMAIKHVRQLAGQWQQGFDQIATALEGEDSGNPFELQRIHDQVAQLTQLRKDLSLQWLKVRFNNESEAALLNQQRSDLTEQIWQLEAEIKSQKVVSQEQLQQVVADFQNQDAALNRAIRTTDADVFYEALELYQGDNMWWLQDIGFAFYSLVNNPVNQYRITPYQLVFEASGWRNQMARSADLRYAAQLYLCDIGWDCGAESAIVMSYCLFGIYSYPAACGQSLPAFLQNHLISPNRWQDVMHFKNLYKELYHE
jgi:cytochrome c556